MKKRIRDFVLRNFSIKGFVFLIILKNVLRGKKPNRFMDVNGIFHILSRNKDLFFIQIGSNDGVTNDPIRPFILKYRWSGILVEPIPNIFQKLVENYKDSPNLKFENVGIGDKNEMLPFYALPAEINEPDWLQQIGSFSKEAFVKNASVIPGLTEKMIIQNFHVIKWSELLKRNDVKAIDLLNIDAEGFEYIILKQLKEGHILPKMILFEWGSMDDHDFSKTNDLLRSMNYKLYNSGGDVLCVQA
ncbi:MAG: FkbM family methyltransferase [Cyclobacteriaceae bacterium]